MKKYFAIFSFIVLVVCLLCNTTVFADNFAGFIKIPANGSIKEFYIGQYPVTNSEYKSFIDSTGSKAPNYWKGGTYPNGKSNHPVIFVSYNDALAYCKWLEKKYPNYSFRLPTVSEWEYAASGGRGYAFPWGNQMNENNFNYNKLVASVYLKQNPTVTYNNQKSTSYGQSMPLNKVISINPNGGINGWIDHKKYTGFVYTDLFKKLMDNGGYTTPVNQYPSGKSPFGVYDMSGNVWEWTSSQITATNGAEKGQTVYAVKGGSWYANANSCKITMQGEGRRPNTGYNTVGFRVVAVNKSNSTSYNTENNNTNITRKSPTTNSQGKQFNPNGQNQKKRPDKKPPLKPGGNKTPANWN
jgi:formylglycine-generating enzyme required for sulfatase activity